MMRLFYKRIVNIFLPPKCISCGDFIEDIGGLCSSCWRKINFIGEPLCTLCGLPFEYAVGEEILCGNCIAKTPSYDKARSVFLYNEHSSKLITGFKYNDNIHAAKSFANWMVKIYNDILADADVIAPVPLHRIRLFTRRYNQSALLATAMSQQTGKQVIPTLLFRIKHNAPQASLPRKDRLSNVKGAFILNKKYATFIIGKRVILVDDVMTTGATVDECTSILKKAGVKKVSIITLGRTL